MNDSFKFSRKNQFPLFIRLVIEQEVAKYTTGNYSAAPSWYIQLNILSFEKKLKCRFSVVWLLFNFLFQRKTCLYYAGHKMAAQSQEVSLLSYPCPSLAARVHFWRSPLKSSPPGCCRLESKHNKEIKYECEKLARMALPPLGPAALHNALRWQEKFMAICWIKRRRMGEKCYERELSHSTLMTEACVFFTSLVQLLHASLRTNRQCWPPAHGDKIWVVVKWKWKLFPLRLIEIARLRETVVCDIS